MSSRSNLIAVASGLNRPGVLPKGWTAVDRRTSVVVVRHWTHEEIVITPTGAWAHNLPGWVPKRAKLKREWVAKMVEEVASVAALLEAADVCSGRCPTAPPESFAAYNDTNALCAENGWKP